MMLTVDDITGTLDSTACEHCHHCREVEVLRAALAEARSEADYWQRQAVR
jgi:hypothetical protein